MTLAGFLMTHLLAVSLLAVTAYVLGRLVLARVAFESRLEMFVCCTTLGLGSVSLMLFLLGLLGGFSKPALIILLAGIWLAAYPVWRHWLLWRPVGRKFAVGLLACVLVLAVLSPMWLLAHYPPADWDDISYHLASAKEYAQHGRLIVTPYLRFAVFPQAVNMLFTLCLILADDITAQLVSTLMWILTGLLLFAWGRRDDSIGSGLLAACLWLASPTVIRLATTAYIDVGLTLFVVCGAYGLFRWIERRDRAWLLFAAFATGMAAGAKYSGLFFLGFYTLAVVAASHRREMRSSLPAFAGLALATALPWYVRNTIVTGDPFFPALSAWISNPYWNPGDIALQRAELASHGIGRTPLDLVTVWWDIGWNQGLFQSESLASLALIIPIPVLLVLRWRSFRARVLLTLSLTYVLLWFHTGQIMRYLLPILPFLALELATAVDSLLRWIFPAVRKNLRALATAVLAVFVIGQGILYGLGETRSRGPIPTDQKTRQAYLSTKLPEYPAYLFLNRRLGDRYTLYALRGGRMTYYAEGEVMGDVFGPARASRIEALLDDGQRLYDELRGLGVDHFLISQRSSAAEWAHDDAFQRHFRLIYQDDDTRLYKLLPENGE